MSDPMTWDLTRTALLTIDLQNDFLHPEGAYGRAGQKSEAIAALRDTGPDVTRLVSHRLTLDEIPQVMMQQGPKGALKIQAG